MPDPDKADDGEVGTFVVETYEVASLCKANLSRVKAFEQKRTATKSDAALAKAP